MKRVNLEKFFGFEYLTITGVPATASKEHGELVSADVLARCERIAAKAIISNRIPLRGKEVRFIRKVLGLSLQEMADALELSPPAVLKWEKAAKERLLSTNQVSVRALFAERMGVKLQGTLTELRGLKKPVPISVSVKAA